MPLVTSATSESPVVCEPVDSVEQRQPCESETFHGTELANAARSTSVTAADGVDGVEPVVATAQLGDAGLDGDEYEEPSADPVESPEVSVGWHATGPAPPPSGEEGPLATTGGHPHR